MLPDEASSRRLEEIGGELERLEERIAPDEILLVVDAMTGQEAVKVAGAFKERLDLSGLMLSKLDGDARGGALLSVKHVTGVPIKFIGTGEAQKFYTDANSNWLATANDADTSGYDSLQNKGAELIASASNIAQFLDRDTRPDFASTVVLPSIQTFLNNPEDINGLTDSMEEHAVAIFTD